MLDDFQQARGEISRSLGRRINRHIMFNKMKNMNSPSLEVHIEEYTGSVWLVVKASS